jgi:hypothetical protein
MRRELISHHQATREKTLVFARGSVRLEPLAPELHGRAPLELAEIGEVFGLTWKAETLFERPQDVEWTYWGNILFVLQSDPSPPTILTKPILAAGTSACTAATVIFLSLFSFQ